MSFPDTRWSRVIRLRHATTEEKRDLLGDFFERYRRPILAYLRWTGYDEPEADDVVQGFFITCIEKDVLEKADRNKAKFRSFLLLTLKRYASKQRRGANAARRSPSGGFVEFDEVVENSVPSPEPEADSAFEREWVRAVVDRAVDHVRQEYSGGRRSYFEILKALYIDPQLESAPAPSHRELAARFDIPLGSVGDRLTTAKRAFKRHLRAEIEDYMQGDAEVEQELREQFKAFRD